MRPGLSHRPSLLLVLLGVAWGCAQAEDGPAPVAWDRVSCAECRMLVGDPRFAAQLRTAAGELRFFDDPGCLLLHLAHADVEARAVWLHHFSEDRWLRLEETGFVAHGPSPMGYGLGAAARGVEGALSPEAALQRLGSAP